MAPPPSLACHPPPFTARTPPPSLPQEDGYYIRSGIVCVLRNATIPDGTVI